MGFVALACAHLLLTQDSSFAMKSVTAAAITVAIGFGGYAKKSLDLTGALPPAAVAKPALQCVTHAASSTVSDRPLPDTSECSCNK